jgi:hypothetical protein
MPKKIKLPAREFAQYKKLSAERASIDKAIKALKDTWNLPEAKKRTLGEYVIVNENSDEIGKMTIYFREAFPMPACYIAKIS